MQFEENEEARVTELIMRAFSSHSDESLMNLEPQLYNRVFSFVNKKLQSIGLSGMAEFKKRHRFNKMTDFPEQEKGETFSIPVLVYSLDDPTFCEIGHYDFNTGMWSHFGDDSINLICWCYLPDATEFVKRNRLKPVKHTGYSG